MLNQIRKRKKNFMHFVNKIYKKLYPKRKQKNIPFL